MNKLRYSGLTIAAGLTMAVSAQADNVILDDLIVDGSACIGLDCVNGESFGFDTLRLKENNLRIKFQDTSASASFPSNDWEITINDSSNGGGNFFAITDIDNNRRPFTIEGGAPANSLFVEDSGQIGIGESTPVVEVHISDGDTPTVRLEQDGTSGFTPQTFDIAANETNFFVRDVTNGSQLPFKIKPGADHNSLVIDSDNDVGIGTVNPASKLHVLSTTGSLTDADFLVEQNDTTSGNDLMFALRNANGRPIFEMQDESNGVPWRFSASTSFVIQEFGATPSNAMILTEAGDMTILGKLTSGSSCIQLDTFACTAAAGNMTCAVASCP